MTISSLIFSLFLVSFSSHVTSTTDDDDDKVTAAAATTLALALVLKIVVEAVEVDAACSKTEAFVSRDKDAVVVWSVPSSPTASSITFRSSASVAVTSSSADDGVVDGAKVAAVVLDLFRPPPRPRDLSVGDCGDGVTSSANSTRLLSLTATDNGGQCEKSRLTVQPSPTLRPVDDFQSRCLALLRQRNMMRSSWASSDEQARRLLLLSIT
jgi:hypothetical protein